MEVEKKLPENMIGHIIVFDEPLIVQQTECKYMRVSGGFGAHIYCSGRMIIGEFFKTIKDIQNNKPLDDGNTKCYPSGYIPELFKEVTN